MVRRVVGRLFGFAEEIESLRKQLEELRWDTPFGMWTRGAFVQICRVMPRGLRYLAFIDLDRINELNEQLGYSVVDDRVRATFSVPFRRSDVVARWYSGDEIVILFDPDRQGAELKIGELYRSAERFGLTFAHAIGDWNVGQESVEDAVPRISKHIATQKRQRNKRKSSNESTGPSAVFRIADPAEQ